MERRDLYQDDLTEERQPSPAVRDDVAHTQALDPEITDQPERGDGDAPEASEDR